MQGFFFLFVLLHIVCFQLQHHSISLSLSFSFSLDFPIFSTCFYSLAPFDKRSLSPFPKCKQLESHKMLQFVALFTFTFAAFTFTYFSLLIDVHSHFHQVPTTWRREVSVFPTCCIIHFPPGWETAVLQYKSSKRSKKSLLNSITVDTQTLDKTVGWIGLHKIHFSLC